MHPPTDEKSQLYEIRLVESANGSLVFAAAKASEREALELARRLLERHPEHDCAEVWRGMTLFMRV
jgi:hypothetical protein